MNMNPYQSYQRTRVETASPLQLVIMLYDGALRYMNHAKQALNAKDVVRSNELLQKAQDIISELTITLNPEAGEITANLAGLYEYVDYCLIQANIKKDPEWLEPPIQIMSTLRSGWAELQVPTAKVVG